jgi:hypothetical protein
LSYKVKYIKNGIQAKYSEVYSDVNAAKNGARTVKAWEGISEIWIEDLNGKMVVTPAQIMDDGK